MAEGGDFLHFFLAGPNRRGRDPAGRVSVARGQGGLWRD